MAVTRRILTLVLSIALAVAATAHGTFATPRGEHFKVTFEFTERGMDNPCTPGFDDITLDIRDHAQGSEWEESGTLHFDVHVSGQAKGVAADGTVYMGKLNVHETGTAVDGSVSVDFQVLHRLISHGSTPDFFLQEWGHFSSPPGSLTFERQKPMCRPAPAL